MTRKKGLQTQTCSGRGVMGGAGTCDKKDVLDEKNARCRAGWTRPATMGERGSRGGFLRGFQTP